MKKTAVIICIIGLLTSVFACVPAAAYETQGYIPDGADYSAKAGSATPDQEDIPEKDPFALPEKCVELDKKEELQIVRDYQKQFNNKDGKPEDYTVQCFLEMSNGMKLVYVETPGEHCYPSVCMYSNMGEYQYMYAYPYPLLYKNGTFTEIPDAYADGLIKDADLDELATVLNIVRHTPSDDSFMDRIIYTERDFDDYPNFSLPLDDAEKLKIARDFKAQYNTSGDPEDYTVLLFLNLSNGMKLVFVEEPEWCYDDVLYYSPMGDYVYTHGERQVRLYKDGVFTELSDAYKNGLIDDALLAEIDTVMHFDRIAPKTTEPEMSAPAGKPQPTEAVTKPTAAAKPATRDQATPESAKDSVAAVKNANDVIATGESGALWIALIVTLTAAVAGVYVYFKKRV